MSRERSWRVTRGLALADAALVVVALFVAAPSLLYPPGNDQALFSYAGAAWHDGQLPYRDFVDLKPPGIYLVHALMVGVFGWNAWAMRLVDVGLAAAIGLGGALSLQRQRARRPVEIGVVTVATVTFYFFSFDFWSTAQVELWEAAALLVAYGLLAAGGQRPWHQLGAGVALGVGCLFKPTVLVAAIPLLALPLLEQLPSFIEGGWARGLAGARVAAGIALPGFLALAYFGAHEGGLAAAHDILVGLLSHYVAGPALTAGEIEARLGRLVTTQLQPTLGCLSVGWAWAVGRRWRSGDGAGVRAAAVPALLLLGGVASVFLQGKLFWYHWAVLTTPVALLAAVVASELASVGRGAAPLACAALLAGSWVFAPASTLNSGRTYPQHAASALRFLMGGVDRATFLLPFRDAGFHYSAWDEERIGTRIRAMASPGDRLQVFPTTLSVYVAAGLLAPTRFPATHFLTHPALDYRRREWWAEFDRQFFASPPRFAVVSLAAPSRLHQLLSVGYKVRFRSGDLLVLEYGSR